MIVRFCNNDVTMIKRIKLLAKFANLNNYCSPNSVAHVFPPTFPPRDGIWRVNTCHGSIYESNTAKIWRRPSKFGLEYRKRFIFLLLSTILTGVLHLKFQPCSHPLFVTSQTLLCACSHQRSHPLFFSDLNFFPFPSNDSRQSVHTDLWHDN